MKMLVAMETTTEATKRIVLHAVKSVQTTVQLRHARQHAFMSYIIDIYNLTKSNGLLGIAALMLDYNNIEVMCLQLITLRIVSVDNTIAVTK